MEDPLYWIIKYLGINQQATGLHLLQVSQLNHSHKQGFSQVLAINLPLALVI